MEEATIDHYFKLSVKFLKKRNRITIILGSGVIFLLLET